MLACRFEILRIVTAPTGLRMEIRYCSVMRVDDGKVFEGRDYYDSASITRQLGFTDD